MSDPGVKLFADGADRDRILELCRDPRVRGFTTNPTLMRQAGVTDYEDFARAILPALDGRPISLEVFSDDFDEMYNQARRISSWGGNVYVKVPITNTRGHSSADLLRQLTAEGVRVNVTAILTLSQIESILPALSGGPPGFVSVFAGRIADAGRDPVPVMRAAVSLLAPNPNLELIWASPREVLNIVQASDVGCHIITVTYELMKKMSSLGRDLEAFSLDTVRMFYDDAVRAGYRLRVAARQAAG